jgi:hypothetical protein
MDGIYETRSKRPWIVLHQLRSTHRCSIDSSAQEGARPRCLMSPLRTKPKLSFKLEARNLKGAGGAWDFKEVGWIIGMENPAETEDRHHGVKSASAKYLR